MRRLRSSSIKSRGVAFLALLVCLFGLPAFGQPWDGNGVEGDPYLIYDACDMQAIGANPAYWNAHFRLMADIDLSDFNGIGGNPSFNIIGSNPLGGGTSFTGVFDGNGKCIDGLTISSNSDYVGLFGYLQYSNTSIVNVTLMEPNIIAPNAEYVGSLVGFSSTSEVANCTVISGRITGSDKVGGLAGFVSRIRNCAARNQEIHGRDYVGGLVGDIGVIVEDCNVEGQSVYGQNRVGGLWTEDREV